MFGLTGGVPHARPLMGRRIIIIMIIIMMIIIIIIIMGLGTQCCKTAECPLRPATYTAG